MAQSHRILRSFPALQLRCTACISINNIEAMIDSCLVASGTNNIDRPQSQFGSYILSELLIFHSCSVLITLSFTLLSSLLSVLLPCQFLPVRVVHHTLIGGGLPVTEFLRCRAAVLGCQDEEYTLSPTLVFDHHPHICLTLR